MGGASGSGVVGGASGYGVRASGYGVGASGYGSLVIIVSACQPSPKNWVFGFFRLGLPLGSGFWACWDRGLGTWTWA